MASIDHQRKEGVAELQLICAYALTTTISIGPMQARCQLCEHTRKPHVETAIPLPKDFFT